MESLVVESLSTASFASVYKGIHIKTLKMDCQPTEFTALSRHRAVFSWAGKGGIPIYGLD